MVTNDWCIKENGVEIKGARVLNVNNSSRAVKHKLTKTDFMSKDMFECRNLMFLSALDLDHFHLLEHQAVTILCQHLHPHL